MSALAPFGPATRALFQAAFPEPTPVQIEGWAALSQGGHALLLAPTGSGKTENWRMLQAAQTKLRESGVDD